MEKSGTSAIQPSDDEEPKIIKRKWGIKVPSKPREQAIFYNKSLDVTKIKRICEAVEEGATWRIAAAQAGMYPSEFEYMIKLGRAGHPVYGQVIYRLLEARGVVARKLISKMMDHAMSDEGVADGTLEKMIKAEERDSWIDVAPSETANTGSGVKVNINVNFGDEKTVDHSKSEVLDAEFEEFEEMEETA